MRIALGVIGGIIALTGVFFFDGIVGMAVALTGCLLAAGAGGYLFDWFDE